MSVANPLRNAALLLGVVGRASPLGGDMTRVFERERTSSVAFLLPVEAAIFRMLRVPILIATALVVGASSDATALCLGPIAEHLGR